MLEKELKRLIVRINREVYGKGPEDVWVQINYNIATFCCSKSLTHMEEFLLSVPGGEEEVLRLRKNVAGYIKPRLLSEIEIACGVKVLRLTADLCVRTKTLFGAILFQDGFDEKPF